MAELASWDDVFASVEEAKAGPKPAPKEPQSWDDVDTAIKEVESGFNPDYLKELRTAEAVAQTVVNAPPLGAAEWGIASQVSPEYQRAALERSAELFKKRGPMKGRGTVMRNAVAAVQGYIEMASPVTEFFAPKELQLTGEQEAFRQALIATREENDPSLSEGWIASTIQKGVRMAPPMLMMGSVGRASGAVGSSLGLGAKGATAAQGLGVAAAAYPMASDQSYRSLIAEGVDPKIAAPVSRVSGVLEGAIEMLNLDPFKVQPGVLKGTVRQIVTEAARRLGVQAGRIGLEAFEEGSQAFTREAVAEAARAIDEKVPNKGLGQAFAAAAEDGLGSIGPLAVVMGPGMIASAVGTARNTAARPGQYQEAIKRRDYERFRRELAQSSPPVPPAVETPAEDSPGARLTRLQEMRAKGFVSAEDAAKEGLEGKNRKERLASADAEIERLAKETAAAAETQPAPEDIPTVGITSPDAQPQPEPVSPDPVATPAQALPNPATQEVQTASTQTITIKPDDQSPSAVRERAYLEDEVKAGRWSKSEAENGAVVYSPMPVKPADPVSELDQAEDELAGLFKDEADAPSPLPAPPVTPVPQQTKTTPAKPEQPAQPGWDVVEGKDGKLYRENPNAKSQSERMKTRQTVDPSEGVVLVTKDNSYPRKPIPPETLKARQEFADRAKPGAEFDIKGFETSGPYKVMDDGKLLDTKSGRVMGDVQSRANQVKPGDITWKETPSTAGLSEGTGTTPTTVPPVVSPDAPAKPETSMGETAGKNQPSEARADGQPSRLAFEGIEIKTPFEEAPAYSGKPATADDVRGKFKKVSEGFPGVRLVENANGLTGAKVLRDGTAEVHFDPENLSKLKIDPAGIEAGIEEEFIHVQQRNDGTVPDPDNKEDVKARLGAIPEHILTAAADTHQSFRNGTAFHKLAEIERMREQVRRGGHISEWYNPKKKWAADRLEGLLKAEIELSQQSSAVAAESKGTAAPPTTAPLEQDADIVQAISNFKKTWGMEATATPADKLSAEQQEALDFATSRGQKMAFVDIAKSDKKAPIGSFQRNEKVVLISNALQGDKLWGMIGHEMAHSKGLDEILPADSAELKTMMDEYFQSASPDVQKRLRTNKRDHQREGRARMVQKFFEDKAFRDQLKQDNPTMWEKLREAVLKFIGQWTPKDEAKRMLLDELRAAPKPEKIKGRKPSGSDKPESGLTKPEPPASRTVARTRERAAAAAAEGITPYVTVLRSLSGGRRQYEGYNPTTGERIATGNAIAGPGSVPYKLSNRKGRYQPVDTALYPIGESDTFTTQWYESEAARYDKETDDRLAKDRQQDEAGPTPASADQVNVDSGAASKVKPAFEYGDAVARADDPKYIGRFEGTNGSGGFIVRKDGARTNWPADSTVASNAKVDDQGRVISEQEPTESDFDAEMEKLMAGLAEPESGLTKPPKTDMKPEKAPRKPRSAKKQPAPAKTPEEKSADDRALAAAKKAAAKQAMLDAFKGTKGRPLSGFDPEIGMNVARATKLYIEAGALDFRAFIRDLITDFGKAWVEDKSQYFESAWRTANKLKWIDSPTGKVADILTETSNEIAPVGNYPTVKGEWSESLLGPKPGSTQQEINKRLAERLLELAKDSRKVGHATGTWFEFNDNGNSVSIRHYYTGTELSILKSDLNKAKSADELLSSLEPSQAKITAAANYGTLEAPNRVELGKHFQQQLESGKDYKSIVEARKEAATLIAGEGATIEPGTPAAKAIDEAVEQGVVRAARSIAESSSDPLKVYDSLLSLYERQPRLAVRTGTSMRQQAYSTPAPAAWIASMLSDTSRDNIAYDSSAGNGMLLLGVDPENAMANELNPDRAEALRELGYNVHEGDATEYIPDTPPERIIINPPFGELEGQTWSIGGTTTDKIDHAIVLKTLESMTEDGKAVLIIGSKGFEQRQPKDELRRGEAYKNDKNFYNALYDGYNVTDHFTLHGDLYAKQGAAFPIDVIVIDGRGRSELPKPYQIDRQNAIPRVITSWQELRDVGERYLDTGTGRPSDLSTEPVADDLAGLSSLLEGQGENTGGKGSQSGRGSGGRGGVPPRGADSNQQAGGDSGQSSVSGASDQPGSDRPERLPSASQPDTTTRPDGGNDAKKLDRETDVGSEDGLQLPYSQRSSARNVGTLVPATHARAVQEALEKAELRYGNLDDFVAKELGYKPKELMNYFSAEQIDALALNIARHKEGKAFVLGDQTGVGKGRVAAATMVYAKRQGLVPVFMTQSPDLFADMYRDLQDIGQHSEGEPFYALATNTLTGKDKIELPDGTTITQTADFAKDTINEVARNVANELGPIAIITVQKTTDADGNPLGTTPTGRPRVRSVQEQREYDAVFSTYSQMQTVGGDTKDRHTAMSIIASKAFFVLDESHNAGGVKAKAHDDHTADISRAARLRELVSESQGVLFLSATYAKNPDVMDLYAKTGMADAIEGGDEALIETINKGGIPLQQVLSEMLVESGAYMRREKSFDGIEFGAVVKETGRQEAGEIAGIFDSINSLDKIKNDIIKTEAFQRWLTASGLGLGKDSATGKRGMDSSQFSSIVHNLVDQMLLSIKADAVADEAIASLERGESPVIALSNTAGAALDNYLAEFPAEVGDEIEFGFNSTAYRYLERSREIMLTDVDASGKKTSRRVRLPDDVLGPDGVQAYIAAKDLIDNFAADIPASPIDHIRNRLEKAGYKVAEITGRDMMVDYSGNKMRLARRPSSEQGKSGKLTSVRGYNSGEIHALILNQSGSTGLSAHASSKFINQKRRHMIVAQADRNIDTFMQMLGRINRTGQVEQHKGQPKGSNLPRYTLLMTDVPAEIRPASVLIKKLSSLNANVTADAKGSVSFDAPDILNKVGDRVVAEYIADNPALNHVLDDIVEVNAEGSPKVFPDIARKVSGRMAMRPIPEQQAFWDSVTETYAEEIEQLNKLGKNPLAATKLDLGARTLERIEIFTGDTTADSPFLQPAYADRALVKKQGEPMTPDEIKSAIDKFYGLRVQRKRGPDPFGDMAAELHREAMSGDAQQNVTVVNPNLRQAISAWTSKQIEIASEAINAKAQQQIDRLVNAEAIDRVRSRALVIASTIRRRLNSTAPGMAVAVSEMLEEGQYSGSITGVVIDVKAKKGNEHLPSGWVATIAISSPDRVVRVPFSRIETAGQAGDMYVAPMFEVARDSTYAEWEEIGDVYEERVIGTGNVLAAFDKLVSEGDRGNIVFFTNEEGVSQRGVLMPRSFNLDRWAEKRPATFTNAQQVLDFISIEQGQLNHQANDPNFAIQFVMDGPTMLVRSPRSRQRSGRYTTNRELIEASGTDFVSVGQILQMKVRGKAQQLAVIEAAQKLGPLIAANFKEDAKALISRSSADGGFDDGETPKKPRTKLGQLAEKANQELSDAIDGLANTLKRRPSASANLPNPEVIAAAAKVVAKALKAGTANFAVLMERMVAKYGEKMAKRMEAALQLEWDRQVNAYPVADEDGTPPEMPQPHPELVPPEAIPLTSVKNAIVDELRMQRGETPMPEVTPQTVQQWLDAAGNRIASDPYAGNTLVEQLLSGEKTSVDEMEGMVLQYHYRAVNNLFEAADTKLTDAKSNGDAATIAIAQDEARVIMRRLSAIETALDKAGTAWGRAGVSRQIFLKQDFSLASMVRRAHVANGGNELSNEQVAIISEQADKIKKLQEKIAELEAKTSEQEQAKTIDEAIKKDIEETKKPPAKQKSKVRLKAEERVASAWKNVDAVLKGKFYSIPTDLALLTPAMELIEAYYDLGRVTFREFMAAVAKNIGAKAAKSAEPLFRTAWDQLQTAGVISQPSLDITNVGQLTRFARQVQRSLVENGVTEREEIVDAVHDALREILPEITRRQTMDALSSYGQFSQLSKDPIDQILRDINGQLQQLAKLEDMEQGIAPAKTGVERRSQSDEERRLTQLVNEAKRRGGFVVTDPETQLKSAIAAAKTAVRNRLADMNYEIQTGSRIVRGKTELIPDAELEQLRKDRDELQKVHKAMFPPKGATQAQKIASANRALDAAIASLEAKLAAGDISPAPQAAPLSTPELDAKRARLKALHDQRNALRKIANPGMTDEQKKILALDKSIAELEKQLSTGNFAPKPKPTPLTSPEINARQAKLEELRATKKAILAAANPKMTPEQRASRAYEAHLRKQLAMYLEKIAQGDFEQKPKKQPRVLTKGELDLKKQLADVKHDFFEALAKYHLDNLSPVGRAIDIVRESAHLSRAIMTSIDLSAVLRQGGLGVYSHPAMARKAAAEMWHAIWSREKEFQSMEKLRTRPNAQLYEESGLNITDSEGKLTRQEEAFMGRWARTGIDFAGETVQKATKVVLEPVAASARAYVTFINNLRADLFDVMVENLGAGGQVTKEEAKVIASYINVATGRSDLKSLNEKAAILNTVFFAPRYVASRFQYLAMPFYVLGSSKNSGRVKKLIAKEYARTFTGATVFIGSLTALAYLAAGGDDEEKPTLEFNPLSADLLNPRIGETRLDPLAGLAQVIVVSSRLAAFHTKSSVTGKIKPFYEVGPYETTHASEAWRFIRTKLAPVPGAVVTAFSGMKDVVGDPVTPAGLVGGLFVPISVGEVVSTMQHRGIPKGLALNVLNLLGASVNTYGPKTAYLDATPEERAKQVKNYIKDMNWESDLPAFSSYLSPEDLKRVQDRQNERRGDLVYEAMDKVKPIGEYKTEVHYEEAVERHEKAKADFEEFRKQYAPTYGDALRYLTHKYDDEGGVKVQGARKLKPGFIERRERLAAYYQSQ